MFGAGTDKGNAMLIDDVGEFGVLRQEAVAGMDGLGAGDLAGGDDGGNVEIGLGGGRRADADAFIGQAHMHRIGIGGGMDRDGGDAISLQARLMRSAISPRLAMRIFSNI